MLQFQQLSRLILPRCYLHQVTVDVELHSRCISVMFFKITESITSEDNISFFVAVYLNEIFLLDVW